MNTLEPLDRCECGGFDDGYGCCDTCGVSLVRCVECDGVGHHRPGCPDLEDDHA